MEKRDDDDVLFSAGKPKASPLPMNRGGGRLTGVTGRRGC